jgi:hypothetical protein
MNETDPDVLSPDHSSHVRRVSEDKYIYLGDVTSLRAAAKHNCRLVVGSSDNSFIMSYSIALRNNSAYVEVVQAA